MSIECNGWTVYCVRRDPTHNGSTMFSQSLSFSWHFLSSCAIIFRSILSIEFVSCQGNICLVPPIREEISSVPLACDNSHFWMVSTASWRPIQKHTRAIEKKRKTNKIPTQIWVMLICCPCIILHSPFHTSSNSLWYEGSSNGTFTAFWMLHTVNNRLSNSVHSANDN